MGPGTWKVEEEASASESSTTESHHLLAPADVEITLGRALSHVHLTECVWRWLLGAHRARKEALWSACAAYPDKEAMITDVCVPLSNLPKLIGQSDT